MKPNTYDQRPYATHALAESHPARLAALAHLMDLPVAAPERCSVLELGCGSGGNILPLAERYPQSHFLGIDNSQAHIAHASKVASTLGIANVEFRLADIADFRLEGASFDYVICHGVYSWVAPAVQQRILELCSQAITSNGVALVSYNVLPGWRQRGVIRDIMGYGATLPGGHDPEQQLDRAYKFLSLVASSRKGKDDLYGSYLHEALRRLEGSDRSYLFHEFLAEHNEPCLFSDFMSRAHEVGLQFLSEAKPAFSAFDDLGAEAIAFLSSLDGDLVRREQALDIFRNRMIRETVLCRDAHKLKRDLRASVFKRIFFTTDYRGAADSGPGSARFLEAFSGREVSLPSSEATDVLRFVGLFGGSGCSLESLWEAAQRGELAVSAEAEIMASVVGLWRAGYIEASLSSFPIKRNAQGRALATLYARYQAEVSDVATSLSHRSCRVSSPERVALSLSDGTREFEELVAQVEKVAKGSAREAVDRLLDLGFFVVD